MLIELSGDIQWICLIIEWILLMYLYYKYRKNRDSDGDKVIITKKNGQIVMVLLVVVNVILVISKIIGMFKN
ncbi:hypothetical protein JHL18_07060 [Clostridium sp. YIM B02505]|uniref:Uncharacterized protein n=2 Tax=Clostridium yunnanense TaxID=2800325 RepID=A0ABS1EM21_9CLOT|nr:hypothetical protein [Clostridium yunnanense]